MSTPIRSGTSSPVHYVTEEAPGTAANASASAAPSPRGQSIPEFMRPLLRNRSPVRTAAHAELRLQELPDEHRPQSTREADRLLHGFTTSFHLANDDPLRIDHETYRLLLDRLGAMAEDLPPVRQSTRSRQLTDFAGLIHQMEPDQHLGGFATVLKAVGEELPHEQQRVPLLALIEATGKLSEDLQTILGGGLLDCIARLPVAQRHVPTQAFANRLGESASQVRLSEQAGDLAPFSRVLGDIEKLPRRYQSEPLARLVTALGSQPAQHHAALMAMLANAIRRLRQAQRPALWQALADQVD